MNQRILVPLDGSLTSEAILPQVVRLAAREESEVILVRAEHPIVTENYALIAEAAMDGAKEYLLGIQGRLAPHRIRTRTLEQMGAPADVILRAAAEERVSMIALATHGRTGVSRLILGSVAEQVLRLSPVPVLVLRPFSSYEIAKTSRPEDEPLRKILVAVDGSELQPAVAPHALAFAKLFDARVVLLRVLAPITGNARTTADDEEIENARHALREAAFKFSAAGVACLTLLEEGEAAPKILGIAREHDIDLIAMSTHARRGLSRLVSGSVTEKVLREATVPMLVVNGEKVARVNASRSRRQPSRR
jgi:nucleotide-binding universal stress UspA family protein